MNDEDDELRKRLLTHLEFIYPAENTQHLADELIAVMGLNAGWKKPKPHRNNWNEQDILAITYGDTFIKSDEKPLVTLERFLSMHFADVINSVHILPFYPWSSDDGFSVINYKQVNDKLGDWGDIERIARRFNLTADLVINHCSSRSEWFERYRQGVEPEIDFFIETDPEADLSEVVRPRTNDLLREVETNRGTRYVWCTFSHDQVDLNFANPQVLIEMVSIIRFYIDRGVRIFRFDAIAFLWKEPGTNCLNLPQTHEIVRLLRTLIEHRKPKAIIITETNIPNRQNLAYFGNGNEAHLIYNFALPPLLLHGLLTGENQHLNNWLMSMPPARDGTTYLNFIASHDGIGLRPVEGILDDQQLSELVDTMQRFGARISWRKLSDDEVRPYEINISLYDAMSGTLSGGADRWQQKRFICAHTIMLGLEGLPAFYIHSLLGTRNDSAKVERTGNNRAINRHNWACEELSEALRDPNSHHYRVLEECKRLVRIRTRQPAFHPNATQYTLHLGQGVFAFWRQSRKRDQSVFCIHNISDQVQTVAMNSVNLIETQDWFDLLSGQRVADMHGVIDLQPYDCLWISNLRQDSEDQPGAVPDVDKLC